MIIAVYSPNWVGDATLSLPFIHELKLQNPRSKIIVICKSWVKPIYQNNPNIEDIISFSDKDLRTVLGTIKNGVLLREKKIDLFYTLTDSFRSSLIMWLSRSNKRIGYKSQLRTMFLTSSFTISKPGLHRSNKYLDLIGSKKIKNLGKYIFLDENEIDLAKTTLEINKIKNFVAIFPFSVSSARTFPKKKIREWLIDSKNQYVIFGSEDDKKEASAIIKENIDISIKSFCGNLTLRESISLISLANYAIATDSGLGHISSILGVPTISFFGAGRAKITKPIGSKSIIIDKSERCNPCEKNICCLNAITKSDVNSAIDLLPNI